ncbi:MAG: hypothetical protein P8Y66_07915 [Nitrospirota bacterium]|jgi:hypothetical protein
MKKLRILLCLAAIGTGLYAAFLFGMPKYRYEVFKSDANDIIRFNIHHEKEMVDNFYEKAREAGVPLRREDIHVERGMDGEFRAEMSWMETVDFFGLYQKTFMYSVEVHE